MEAPNQSAVVMQPAAPTAPTAQVYINPSTNPRPQYHKLTLIRDKGIGMVADRHIPMGAHIYTEHMLFSLPFERAQWARQLREVLGSVPTWKREAFLQLFSHITGTEEERNLGTVLNNNRALMKDGELLVGIFLRGARINHSCRPNAIENWDPSGDGTLSLRAIYDIPEGEEITINYRPATTKLGRDERVLMLEEDFDFVCTCPTCNIPTGLVPASDIRRQEIGAINARLWPDLLPQDAMFKRAGLNLVYRLIELCVAEKIWDILIPCAYEKALHFAIIWGDEQRARVFASRAYLGRVIMCGDHHPATQQLRVVCVRPQIHCHWGGALEPGENTADFDENGMRVEMPTEPALFERWLWMVPVTAVEEEDQVGPGEERTVFGHPRIGTTVPGARLRRQARGSG